MNWLMSPYVNQDEVAGQLYGGRSRLHTRRLQDRLRGTIPFQEWERERLEIIKRQVLREISGNGIRAEASLLEVA
jgi:hypothetical protein